VDCHTNPGNFAEYTCITCHANPETNEQHAGVSGYAYNSSACLACHPTGDGQSGFNHNSTMFPLTGAHTTVDCQMCHANGYEGTPTECVACHQQQFNQSVNPNHNSLGLSSDCVSCHTTEPGWSPAKFDIHNQYYPLNGAHAGIASQCITCHNGDYNNTPNTCSGCHIADYNQTTNPSHTAAQFSTIVRHVTRRRPGFRRHLITTINIFRFTVENTKENGINVLIVTQLRAIMPFSPALHVTLIRKQIMITTR
jgi:hypothetical protein